MVMEHFAFICIFGIWLATSISAQICTQPSLLHPEPEYVYFVNGSLLEAVAAFSGDSVDEESCYEKEGYVYKLNEEPLTKYVVLFEGEMALAFSLARDDKLHLPNHQIMPPDDIIDKFKMKLKSQLQGPLRCGNVSLTDIFPTLLNETNIVFDYMERDCEIQLLQSIPIHKNEDEISHPVAEPLTSYFYYEDYFSILYIFALISVAASLVNVIVNFTILRKAKGNGMHLCYGIFFPAFALRAVYGDIQRDQDVLAEVIFLKANEMDKNRTRMIVEDFMRKRGSKHYDYIKAGEYITPMNHHNEI